MLTPRLTPSQMSPRRGSILRRPQLHPQTLREIFRMWAWITLLCVLTIVATAIISEWWLS